MDVYRVTTDPNPLQSCEVPVGPAFILQIFHTCDTTCWLSRAYLKQQIPLSNVISSVSARGQYSTALYCKR